MNYMVYWNSLHRICKYRSHSHSPAEGTQPCSKKPSQAKPRPLHCQKNNRRTKLVHKSEKQKRDATLTAHLDHWYVIKTTTTTATTKTNERQNFIFFIGNTFNRFFDLVWYIIFTREIRIKPFHRRKSTRLLPSLECVSYSQMAAPVIFFLRLLLRSNFDITGASFFITIWGRLTERVNGNRQSDRGDGTSKQHCDGY